jgi:hypothetical protein
MYRRKKTGKKLAPPSGIHFVVAILAPVGPLPARVRCLEPLIGGNIAYTLGYAHLDELLQSETMYPHVFEHDKFDEPSARVKKFQIDPEKDKRTIFVKH